MSRSLPSSIQASEALEAYLTGVVGRRLGYGAGDFTFAEPGRGKRTGIIIIKPSGAPGIVLRCAAKPKEGRRWVRAIELTARHDLPTARGVYADISWRHFRRHGFGAVVEEWLDGEHLDRGTLTEANLEALGRALAALHRLARRGWGTPPLLRRTDYFRYVIARKFRARLETLARHDPGFTDGDRERVEAFRERMHAAWPARPAYHLTHNRINPGNILFRPDGRVSFLDLDTLAYGPPGKDLANTLAYFCEGEAQEIVFREAYFGAAGPERRADFERMEPLFRAWHHLSRWSRKARSHANDAWDETGAPPTTRGETCEREYQGTMRWIERSETRGAD